MINDLDKTLAELLRHSLEPGLYDQVAISFAPPDNSFPPSSVKLPAIDLFLYDVRENRELRTNERIAERNADGRIVVRPPSVRVDCSYLITAWPGSGEYADEHRMIGAV